MQVAGNHIPYNKTPYSQQAAQSFNHKKAVEEQNEQTGANYDIDKEQRAQGAQQLLNILV